MYKIVKGANLSPRELFFFPSKRAKYYKRLALTRWGMARHPKTVARYVSSYYTPYEIIGN